MTNLPPDADAPLGRIMRSRPIPQASDFIAPQAPADRSRNHQRGTRSVRHKGISARF